MSDKMLNGVGPSPELLAKLTQRGRIYVGPSEEDLKIYDSVPSREIETDGLRLLGKKDREFDQKLAEEILSWLPLSIEKTILDRGLNDTTVNTYLRRMRNGTFRPELLQFACCTCSQLPGLYRINGQHTAWARIYYDGTFKQKAQVFVYHAETVEEMRHLYSTWDRGKPRVDRNVIQANLAGTREWNGFSNHMLSTMGKALTFWLFQDQVDRAKIDSDMVSDMLLGQWYRLSHMVAKFVSAARLSRLSKHMQRAPVVAGMLATFSARQNLSKDFWTVVRDGSGVENENDPRLRLRTELMQCVIQNPGNKLPKSRDGLRVVLPEAVFRWCVYCWNAWRQGREIKLLKGISTGSRPDIVS